MRWRGEGDRGEGKGERKGTREGGVEAEEPRRVLYPTAQAGKEKDECVTRQDGKEGDEEGEEGRVPRKLVVLEAEKARDRVREDQT